jgi:hypothetical protein
VSVPTGLVVLLVFTILLVIIENSVIMTINNISKVQKRMYSIFQEIWFLAGDMAQVAQYLPSKSEALSLNPSTAKKKKNLT